MPVRYQAALRPEAANYSRGSQLYYWRNGDFRDRLHMPVQAEVDELTVALGEVRTLKDTVRVRRQAAQIGFRPHR